MMKGQNYAHQSNQKRSLQVKITKDYLEIYEQIVKNETRYKMARARKVWSVAKKTTHEILNSTR